MTIRSFAVGRATTRRVETVRAEDAHHAAEIRRRHLDDGAELLGEQRGQEAAVAGGRGAGRLRVDLEPRMARERHLQQRHDEAAVGAIVIREHQVIRAQVGERGKQAAHDGGIGHIGRLASGLRVDLREHGTAEPRRPPARSMSTSDVGPVSSRSCGVQVSRTSSHGANADTTSETGLTTARGTPSSLQVVRIDIESLPTGMLTPSAGHSSSATARTVSKSAASSPGAPAAAIQLADSLTRDSAVTGAAARFVRASATAIRPEAGASIDAIGVRSPIENASPA